MIKAVYRWHLSHDVSVMSVLGKSFLIPAVFVGRASDPLGPVTAAECAAYICSNFLVTPAWDENTEEHSRGP